MTLTDKIAALPEYPDARVVTSETFYRQMSASYSQRLALAREWIATRVPHLEGCPWRGLTRDTQGLLPDCRCGRDALLKALSDPK